MAAFGQERLASLEWLAKQLGWKYFLPSCRQACKMCRLFRGFYSGLHFACSFCALYFMLNAVLCFALCVLLNLASCFWRAFFVLLSLWGGVLFGAFWCCCCDFSAYILLSLILFLGLWSCNFQFARYFGAPSSHLRAICATSELQLLCTTDYIP